MDEKKYSIHEFFQLLNNNSNFLCSLEEYNQKKLFHLLSSHYQIEKCSHHQHYAHLNLFYQDFFYEYHTVILKDEDDFDYLVISSDYLLDSHVPQYEDRIIIGKIHNRYIYSKKENSSHGIFIEGIDHESDIAKGQFIYQHVYHLLLFMLASSKQINLEQVFHHSDINGY